MDKFTNLMFLLTLSFYLYTPTKQAMHMYQQNRYQMKRYLHWLHQQCTLEKEKLVKTLACLFGMYGLFFVSKDHLPFHLLILLLIIYSYILFKIEEDKTYRKPLVFTHRMQRLLIAFYSCYVVFIVFAFAFFSTNVWIFIMPFLFFFPWPFLVVVGSIMNPVEGEIRRMFMKDAQNRLEEQKDLLVVGITGSYGKTSVKNILDTILADKYYTLKTPHSYNNMMGITLTIRNSLQNLHEIFLCEMGADHVHEITRLMNFVKPQIGMVTAVGPQHLSTFHSIENILKEKMQMIECLPQDGIGVINTDNEYIRSYKVQNKCQLITYGTKNPCDYQAVQISYHKEGTSFHILHKNQEYAFSTRLLGEHNVLNITGAIALANSLHVRWESLQRLVREIPYVEHRLQLRENRMYTILDNAYNSNPEGAAYALDVLSQMEGKHIIVTPGFLDLGELEEQAHLQFGRQMAKCVDEVILVGEYQTRNIVRGLRESEFSLPHLHVVSSIHEAFHLLKTLADKQTTVLLENDLPDAFNH